MKSNFPANMPIVRQRQAGGCSMLIGGFIFAVIGGLVIWFLGTDLTLTCQRSTDTASEINTYLASSEESLSVVQSGKSVRLIGWLFLAVGGLLFLRGLRGVLRMFRTLGFALSKSNNPT